MSLLGVTPLFLSFPSPLLITPDCNFFHCYPSCCLNFRILLQQVWSTDIFSSWCWRSFPYVSPNFKPNPASYLFIISPLAQTPDSVQTERCNKYSSLPCLFVDTYWSSSVLSTFSFFPALTSLPHLLLTFIFFHQLPFYIFMSLPVSLFMLHPCAILSRWVWLNWRDWSHSPHSFPFRLPCSSLITLVTSFM